METPLVRSDRISEANQTAASPAVYPGLSFVYSESRGLGSIFVQALFCREGIRLASKLFV